MYGLLPTVRGLPVETFVCKRCQEALPKDRFRIVRDKRRNATYRTKICKTCTRAKDRETFHDQPDPRRYLTRNWNALCRQRRNKGVYVCPELFGIQGVDYLMELWEHQGGRCALTGVSMTWVSMPIAEVRAGHGLGTSISVDRIQNDKRIGYRKGNLRLVCSQINHMRSALPTEDFLHWCELVIRRMGPVAPDFSLADAKTVRKDLANHPERQASKKESKRAGPAKSPARRSRARPRTKAPQRQEPNSIQD